MKNIFVFLSVLLISSNLTTYGIQSSSLIVGTVQFPQALSTVPMIRIYSSGKKIPYPLCEQDNESKQFTFRIPQVFKRKHFTLLITKKIHFETVHTKHPDMASNVIEYLKVLPDQAYKFYNLRMIEEKSGSNEKAESTYRWDIQEKKLENENGQIPDEAIIICYDPDCIDVLTGGSAFELPTINVKHDILQELGSEANLHDLSNALLLASIDSDTIHAAIKQEVKQNAQTTIIAPVA